MEPFKTGVAVTFLAFVQILDYFQAAFSCIQSPDNNTAAAADEDDGGDFEFPDMTPGTGRRLNRPAGQARPDIRVK